MYRPAGFSSGSEDDDYACGYNGFRDSYKPSPVNRQITPENQPEDLQTTLINAVTESNTEEIKRVLGIDRMLKDGKLRDGWPVLFHACRDANCKVAEYLLSECDVDVNQAYDLQTALMVACDSVQPSSTVHQTVAMLLYYGAVINVSDTFGMTPIMFACTRGHTSVVQEMVDQVAIGAKNNEGKTALYLAVRNRYVDIVRMLLKAKADPDESYGILRTAREEAELAGYDEILSLFPVVEKPYDVPIKYKQYSHYTEIVQGSSGNDMPKYFPEIESMLFGMCSEQHLNLFAQADVGLVEFLTISDERLDKLGIFLPIERKRIHLGLYDFHQHRWNKKSLQMFPSDHKLDTYDVMEILGNILKQLVVLNASMTYTRQLVGDEIFNFAFFSSNMVEDELLQLKLAIARLRADMQRFQKLAAPKPVMHIDKDSCRANQSHLRRVIPSLILVACIATAVYKYPRLLPQFRLR